MPLKEDVDEVLRQKRKAREHKACYPCRQRKVKCDLSRPCQTCRDRDHPELCSYHPPDKRRQVDDGQVSGGEERGSASSATAAVTLSKTEFDMLCRKIDGLENSISEIKSEWKNRGADEEPPGLRPDIPTDKTPEGRVRSGSGSGAGEGTQLPRHQDVHGLHTRNDAGELVHFGGGSIPAMLYSISEDGGHRPQNTSQKESSENNKHQLRVHEALGQSVLPLFGLDNESALYPFVDLWGLPHASRERAEQLVQALPNDEQLMKFWISYRDLAHMIYPGIADLHDFENHLHDFLRKRSAQTHKGDGITEVFAFGEKFCWLGLLFAVLASGAQCGERPRRERELTSQVYVCCGFECLRFNNFLSQPHVESIQALLVIGSVVTNNMNAGTAWSLLGLTIRLAQGLGLHRACPPNVAYQTVFFRSKVWWAVVWQDSLLSITYDRASSVATPGVQTMGMPQNYGEISSYHQSMYRLCQAGLDIVRDRTQTIDSQDFLSHIPRHRNVINEIIHDSAEYMQYAHKCRTSTEDLQYRAFYLHSSYFLAELFRPAISAPSSTHSDVVSNFRKSCIDHLCNTVEAYLQLIDFTSYARKSWAAIHRSLSSALLLGILGEHLRNERARRLIGRFIAVMTGVSDQFDEQENSAPVQRGLAALQKLNIEPLRDGHEGRASSFSGRGHGKEPRREFNEGAGAAMYTSDTSTGASTEYASSEDHSPYVVLSQILWGDECGFSEKAT